MTRTHYKEQELLPLIEKRLGLGVKLSATVIMESVQKIGGISAGCDRLFSISQIEEIEKYIKRRSLSDRNGFLVFEEGD